MTKRYLFFVVVLLATSFSANATNFFVDSTTAASGDGSIERPWKLLANIDWTKISSNLLAGTNVSLSLKSAGVWRETLTVAGNGPATLTVQPYGVGAPPLIDASGLARATYCVGKSNLVFQGIDFTRAASYNVEVAGSANCQFLDCRFIGGSQNLYLNNSANITLLSCCFSNGYGNQSVLVSGANTSFAFYYCLFTQSDFTGVGLSITGGGVNSRVVNCTFAGAGTYHINNVSLLANVGITNSVFSGYGNSVRSLGGDAVKSSGGNVVMANCLVMKNGKDFSRRVTGVSEVGTVYGEPQYTQTRRKGIWCFTQDDSQTVADWLILADMATNYGFRTGLAVTTGVGRDLSPSAYSEVQTRLNAGHEIYGHSTDHCDLGQLLAFSIRYVGAGSGCVMTISNSILSTSVTGGPGGEDLNIGLTNASYSTSSSLINSVDALAAYQCSIGSLYNGPVPSFLLTNLQSVDIATAAYPVYYDFTNFFSHEITTNVALLEARLTNYTGRAFIYPNGRYGKPAENWIKDMGLLGARLATTFLGGSYRLGSNNVYEVSTTPGYNLVEAMQFENSTADGSGLNNVFSAHNLGYSSTNAYRGSACASLNGINSYLDLQNDTDFDFTGGDWNLAVYCWPTGTGLRTIYSQGTDASNRFALYLDGNGAVHFDAWAGVRQIINLVTTNSAVTNGGWQYVDVAQEFNRLLLRVNHRIKVVTNTPARLASYTGAHYIGCDYDFRTSVTTNFYRGFMDNLVASRGIYFNTLSVCDLLCEEGDVGVLYHHGEPVMPRSVDAIILDALKDYGDHNPNFSVMKFTEALQYIRTNGTLQSDGFTYVRSMPSNPNYMPQASSILRNNALVLAVAGVTNLVDLSGTLITDSNGVPILPQMTIGAYEYQLPDAASFHAWLQGYGIPSDGSADYLDSDGDGLNNWEEWLCGTNPTDPLSAMRLLQTVYGPSGINVTWASVSNRIYFIERASDLGVLAPFLLQATNILGLPGTTTYTDTNAFGNGPFFYRVGVRE